MAAKTWLGKQLAKTGKNTNWNNPVKWLVTALTHGLNLPIEAAITGFSGQDPYDWLGKTTGISSWWGAKTGQGTDWEKRQFEAQQDWAEREFNRDNDRYADTVAWRNEDVERAERWRQEDIARSSLPAKMQEMQEAGLHPSLAVGAMGGGAIQGTTIQQPVARGSRASVGVGSAGADIDNLMLQAASMMQQSQNDRVQRALVKAEARKTNADARWQELENDFLYNDPQWGYFNSRRSQNWQAEIEKIKGETGLTKEQTSMAFEVLKNYKNDQEALPRGDQSTDYERLGEYMKRKLGWKDEDIKKFLEAVLKSDNFGALVGGGAKIGIDILKFLSK